MAWVLVTGASEGIGAALARRAARDGHDLILAARSEDKLAALAEDLRAMGREAVVIPADLSDEAEADRLWSEATRGRTIGYLLNNAGLGRHGRFGDGAEWDRERTSIAVNVLALTRLMKLAIPHMQEAGFGRILNVASVAGFMPGPNMAVYHATKAYVLSLSEAVAQELEGSKVRVSALCPGPVDTGFFEGADMQDARLLKMARPASAESVADLGWLGARVGTRVVVPGAGNKLFAVLPRFLPRGLLTLVAGRVMSK